MKLRLHAVGIGVTILALMSSNIVISAEYTIKKHDTLYSLARKNGVSVDDIKRANALGRKPIQIGQTLTIPSKGIAVKAEPAKEQKQEQTKAVSTDKEKVRVSEALTKRFGQRVSMQMAQVPGTPELARTALTYRGAPYVRGGTGRHGFDCSGFTRYVYEQYGVNLPHYSGAQAGCGQPVARDEMKPGDLVFFQTRGNRISHVGIYLGNDRFVHAATTRKGVIVSSLSERYYARRFRGARRVASKD